MLFLISSKQNKPNRLEFSEFQKGEEYHVDYARWVVGQGLNRMQQDYLNNYAVNRNFYKNKQWFLPEDLEAFFMDESGQDRNRIRVTRNFVQPMVEQYRGNAERMRFDMKVYNMSPMAKSRRDRSLGQLLAYSAIANQDDNFAAYLRKNNIPIGSDTFETEQRFNALYVDKHVIALNRFLRIVAESNKLDDYKGSLARDVALAGIGIMKPYPYAGDWKFKRVPADKFGWDRAALNPDLSDAGYFFEFDYMTPSTVYEMYQNISDTLRDAIENYVSDNTATANVTGERYDVSGRLPVYTAVWRDVTVDEFGYVRDEFGQRVLKRINYIEPGETKPAYTKQDVITVDKLTPYQKRVLRGESTHNLYVDMWRHCIFIPTEILSGRYSPTQVRDGVLEFGMLPYQEPDLYKPTNMLPPYKCGTWSYVDGETLSPVDVVISPQRLINRFLSVMENQLNNAGGTGVVYDKDLLGQTKEDDFIAKTNRSEPIGIHAKGRGVQNAIGKYDASIKESSVAFAQLIENFRMGIEQVTGVNEGLKGSTSNPDQLVGVMQLMIQRGSIMQEPFYKALTDIYKGCYQSIATSGKRYYIDNEIELIDAVGIESAQILKLTKDVRNEQMRVVVMPSPDPQAERLMVDQQILVWIQYGMLDQPTAAGLLGRASSEEAYVALREFSIKLEQQRRIAQQQQDVMTQQRTNVQDQAGQVIYNEKIRDDAREDTNKQRDRESKERISVNKNGRQ